MAKKKSDTDALPTSANGILRAPAETVYAEELEQLAKDDKYPRPPGWKLSPRAVATYKDVIRANPSFLQAHYNLGVTYARQGDTAAALASIASGAALLKASESLRLCYFSSAAEPHRFGRVAVEVLIQVCERFACRRGAGQHGYGCQHGPRGRAEALHVRFQLTRNARLVECWVAFNGRGIYALGPHRL
jgi:hypothetical protein